LKVLIVYIVVIQLIDFSFRRRNCKENSNKGGRYFLFF